jgi:hypothetical protein
MPTVSTDTGNNPHIAWSGSKTSGTVYYKNKYGGAWKPTISWGSTYTGMSVDVSPQNNYTSLTREFNDPKEMWIAYRSNTGTNLLNSPKTRSWDGSWSSETEEPNGGNELHVMRMALSPRSNERIIATVSGGSGFVDAYVCTPTCTLTDNAGQVWTSVPTVHQQRAAVAYEQLSGQALLVYTAVNADTTKDLAYRTWDGTAWSAEQYLDDTTTAADNTYSQVMLAPRPGSDQIALIAGDNTDADAVAWIWGGSSFGSFTEVTAAGASMSYLSVAVAWESSSGHLLAGALAPSANSNIIYKEYTGSWGSELTFDCGPTAQENRHLVLVANPVSTANDILAGLKGDAYDLTSCYWDGTSWNYKTTHDTSTDSSSRRDFDFAWESTGSKGLLVWGTTAGAITYRTFTAPNTWGGSSSPAMGTYTHGWVQLRTHPTPGSGDPKIYGAVLEDTVLALGAVSWDGTTFTVVGTSTFTANMTSDGRERFDLQFRPAQPWVDYLVCKNLATSNCDASSEFTKWDGTAGFDVVSTGVLATSGWTLAPTYPTRSGQHRPPLDRAGRYRQGLPDVRRRCGRARPLLPRPLGWELGGQDIGEHGRGQPGPRGTDARGRHLRDGHGRGVLHDHDHGDLPLLRDGDSGVHRPPHSPRGDGRPLCFCATTIAQAEVDGVATRSTSAMSTELV